MGANPVSVNIIRRAAAVLSIGIMHGMEQPWRPVGFSPTIITTNSTSESICAIRYDRPMVLYWRRRRSTISDVSIFDSYRSRSFYRKLVIFCTTCNSEMARITSKTRKQMKCSGPSSLPSEDATNAHRSNIAINIM